MTVEELIEKLQKIKNKKSQVKMEFNEFKKKVCNFYRQNSELGYVVDFAPSWSVFVIEAEFKDGDGVKVVFSYKIKIDSLNRQSVQKKVEKLMKELSNDLKGIDNELLNC